MSPPQESIEKYIVTFFNVLHMTRSLKFLNWTPITVTKSFKWASLVSKYGNQVCAESVQDKVKIADVSFLDMSIAGIISAPHDCIFRAIISSPLLSWNEKASEVLGECFGQYLKHRSPSSAAEYTTSVVMQVMETRLSQSSIRSKCTNSGSVISDALSIELLLAIYNVRHGENASEERFKECLDEILKVIQQDQLVAEVFVHCLVLSPGTIACAPSVVRKGLDPECIINISRDPSMWKIVEQFAQADVDKLLSFINPDTARLAMQRSESLKRIIMPYK